MTATAQPRRQSAPSAAPSRAAAARPVLTDAEKLARMHALEGSFYDAANMAGLVWDALSDMFDGRAGGDPPELVGGMRNCFIIDPERLSRLHFAVSHSWSLTEKLKDEMLEALGYGAD